MLLELLRSTVARLGGIFAVIAIHTFGLSTVGDGSATTVRTGPYDGAITNV